MADNRFTALVVDREDGKITVALRRLERDALPPGEVIVEVAYSDLNYKDALALTGQGNIIRAYPMVPGVDLAGIVRESSSPSFRSGDQVLLTGWGVGERHWGGFAQLARVQAEWLLPLPPGMTVRQAMGIGTAGLTAMLCVLALEDRGLTPTIAEDREVVVSGAAGGVGSVAVAILSGLGYHVVGVTGRPEAHTYLRDLGAREVIGRDALPVGSRKPLESQRWLAAVDVAGGEVLAALLSQMTYGGIIAACGLAGGSALATTVFPFILRGVSLLGVDSVMCPQARRRVAWERLAHDLPPAALERITRVVALADVPELAEEILAGRVRGRLIVDVNA
jgi:acrylyl-CoA reductase (NADPH)